MKRVLAYSSISHMGIVLLGIASLNIAGLTGALFQTVSHGFIAALLFFLIFSLTERTGTTRIDELGGMAKAMPVLPASSSPRDWLCSGCRECPASSASSWRSSDCSRANRCWRRWVRWA